MTITSVHLSFLGTNQHRETHENLLIELYKAIADYSKTDDGSHLTARLFDGVGCHGTKKHPTPGTYLCKFGEQDKEGSKEIVTEEDLEKALYKFNNALSLRETRYKISGEGLDSLMLEVVHYFYQITQGNGGKSPSKVVISGFSRGAHAAVAAANLLFLNYPEINIHLFLIDPVPGPYRNNDWDSFTIPPNVRDFNVIYMLNEHLPCFVPQDPKKYIFQSNQTRCNIKMLAGMHGAAMALITNCWGTHCPSSYRLSREALLRFNITHGFLPTDIKMSKNHLRAGTVAYQYKSEVLKSPIGILSDQERFELYCENLKDSQALKERFVAQNLYYHRLILDNRRALVRTPDLFMDEEHRALFKSCYPSVFNWFFEKNIKNKDGTQYTPTQVLTQLNEIRPKSYRSLFAAHFKLPSTGSFDILRGPFGSPCQERSRFNQPLVNDELSYFEYVLTKIVNYYEMHGDAHEKKKKSNQEQFRKIKQALLAIESMDSNEAINHLKTTINEIKISADSGYIEKEVSKIEAVSADDFNQVNDVLMWAVKESSISETQKRLVKTSQDKIELIYLNTRYNAWEKRRKIQNCLIWLHSELETSAGSTDFQSTTDVNDTMSSSPHFFRRLKKNRVVKHADFASLSEALCRLSEAGYTETNLVDSIVYQLQSYQFWMNFWFYFMDFCFVSNREPVNIAQTLEQKLLRLKAQGAGNNMVAINCVLVDAKKELSDLDELKPLAAVAPSLNKILVKAIQETTLKRPVLYAPPEETLCLVNPSF